MIAVGTEQQTVNVRLHNHGSWHYRGGVRNQFQRAYRWYVRLQNLQSGTLAPVGQDYCLLNDYLLTFFGACFALRDWARHEKDKWPLIRSIVDAHPALMLCRDIANQSKHRELNDPSIDANFLFASGYTQDEGHRPVMIVSPGKLEQAAASVQKASVSQPVHRNMPTFIDVMKLAVICMESWSQLLVRGGYVSEAELQNLKETAFNHQGF